MELDRFLENLDQTIEKAPAQYRTGLKKFFGEVLLHTHNSKSKANSQPTVGDFKQHFFKLVPLLHGKLHSLAIRAYLEALYVEKVVKT